MTGCHASTDVFKHVVTFIFSFMAEGVKTAWGMIDYDGPAERDITFILFASQ